MAFTLRPFRPSLTLSPPVETNHELRISLAKWDSQATVEITNEPGTFRVGWIQVLQRNEVKGIYDNHVDHRCEKQVNCRTPVGDRVQAAAPWYWDHPAHSPTVVGMNPGMVLARPYMMDQPRDSFPILHCGCGHGDARLIEVKYELSFRTWLAVRDTAAVGQNFRAVLYNFSYTIQRRFVMDYTKLAGHRAASPTLPSPPGIERYNPPLPVPACAWAPAYANTSVVEVWHAVQLVRA
ncbi:MAG: hypothetical protein LAO56_04395 [Acidobacteriia bacterium]|nr:hypothetical protein [Terriglobia bacterium]